MSVMHLQILRFTEYFKPKIRSYRECTRKTNVWFINNDQHIPNENWIKLGIYKLKRVLGYRSGGPGSIPGTYKKKVVGLERGPLSLMSTTEELLDRKVAAPV
jgi:hypothetical protein